MSGTIRFTLTLCLFCLMGSGWAQGVRFYAKSDSREIVTSSYTTVSFVLENANGTNFKPPDFGAFEILSGPSVSNSMQIINGRSSRSTSYVYTITASKPGTYQVGSASISANGKNMRSIPISIKVVQGKDPGLLNEEELLFVRMELSDSTAVIGQQIQLKYVLYKTKSVRPQKFEREDPYDGFYTRVVRDFTDRPKTVILDGVQYTAETIKIVTLFPQQTGLFEFSPASLIVGIPVKGSRQRSLFFTTPMRQKRLMSNGAKIQVSNLPTPVPDSFSGAVGQYIINTTIDKRAVKIGETITINVRMSGNGDGKMLSIPQLNRVEGLDYFDPNIIEEQTVEDRGQLVNTRFIEYLIVPEIEGRFILRPEISYFNPDSNEYIIVRKGPYSIRVSPGKITPEISLNNIEDQQLDILPLKPSSSLKTGDSIFFRSKTHWSLLSVMLVCIVGMFGVKYFKVQRGKIDTIELKSLRASRIARKRLKVSHGFLEANDLRAFYDELSKAMLGYASDKLKIQSADLTKDELRLRLNSLDINDELVDDFVQLLTDCEIALFARSESSEMKQSYDRAARIISEIETSLK